MDTQLIIVMLCIAAAAYYFGRRVYTSIRKGKCGGCDGGCDSAKKSSCGCTPNDAEAQRLESRRLKFEPKK
ncbi:FeoB-associated Cys-rich membrane protein [Desulfovibrio desulfuricans]|uniref:FeoB-associated Cys-rich membrane protein n=1 Tax=Desulfovibrio desulfuricans TaxID=876 RepID=A0A4V1CX34_DESDE|nr:FeoB-associated Cys-rich membrane protein [Desulfovibrio desulfuricans]QCC84830.1 FeoB-associated Cys-rich membrane protein [Desulfovibrio desulfuricans]